MVESGKRTVSVGSVVDMLLEQDVDLTRIDFGGSPGDEAAQIATRIANFVEEEDVELWRLRANLERAIDDIDDLDASGLIIAGIQTQWRRADLLFDQAVKAHMKLATKLRGL